MSLLNITSKLFIESAIIYCLRWIFYEILGQFFVIFNKNQKHFYMQIKLVTQLWVQMGFWKLAYGFSLTNLFYHCIDSVDLSTLSILCGNTKPHKPWCSLLGMYSSCSQEAFTCSKLLIETLEKGVKCVKS